MASLVVEDSFGFVQKWWYPTNHPSSQPLFIGKPTKSMGYTMALDKWFPTQVISKKSTNINQPALCPDSPNLETNNTKLKPPTCSRRMPHARPSHCSAASNPSSQWSRHRIRCSRSQKCWAQRIHRHSWNQLQLDQKSRSQWGSSINLGASASLPGGYPGWPAHPPRSSKFMASLVSLSHGSRNLSAGAINMASCTSSMSEYLDLWCFPLVSLSKVAVIG